MEIMYQGPFFARERGLILNLGTPYCPLSRFSYRDMGLQWQTRKEDTTWETRHSAKAERQLVQDGVHWLDSVLHKV
jgi:hypothetical protein